MVTRSVGPGFRYGVKFARREESTPFGFGVGEAVGRDFVGLAPICVPRKHLPVVPLVGHFGPTGDGEGFAKTMMSTARFLSPRMKGERVVVAMDIAVRNNAVVVDFEGRCLATK